MIPSTLTRYLLKRVQWPLFGAALFYGGLLLANELIRISRQIFSLGAPYHWLLPMLGAMLPEVLGFVLPMAAVLGGLWAAQEMSQNSEVVASQGLGIGKGPFLRAWLLLSLGLVAFSALDFHLFIPWAARLQGRLQIQMYEEARIRFLRPGGPPRFPARSDGQAVWMAPEGRVHLMESNAKQIQHLVAENLKIIKNQLIKDENSITFLMTGIRGFLLHRESGRVVLVDQASQTVSFELPASRGLLPKSPLPHLSTPELLERSEPEALVEFGRRLALPFASSAFLLLGLALGLGHPRFSRGAPMLKSLGIILIYYVLLKYLEEKFKIGDWWSMASILCLPLFFLGWGLLLLYLRFRPHGPSHSALLGKVSRSLLIRWSRTKQALNPLFPEGERLSRHSRRGVLSSWSWRLWIRNWGGVLASLLVLNLVIEYASLAGDLSQNHAPLSLFLLYWAWNLPPFMVVVLPTSFLLGATLALSETAIHQEWTALRSTGAGLARWVRASAAAWGSSLLATVLLQVWIAPLAFRQADGLYRRILNRPPRSALAKPWLHLGATGVLWHLDGQERWGFPLQSPGNSPMLLHWRVGETHSEGIPWGEYRFVQGAPSQALFPDQALRTSSTPEGTSTRDLFQWQRWAPDPERAVLLWERFLGWLAGPALVFAMVASAFPRPREGRGKALGSALTAGLAFLGLQALFGGAARAGEIPAYWGVAAPMLFLVAFGFLRLRQLRT